MNELKTEYIYISECLKNSDFEEALLMSIESVKKSSIPFSRVTVQGNILQKTCRNLRSNWVMVEVIVDDSSGCVNSRVLVKAAEADLICKKLKDGNCARISGVYVYDVFLEAYVIIIESLMKIDDNEI